MSLAILPDEGLTLANLLSHRSFIHSPLSKLSFGYRPGSVLGVVTHEWKRRSKFLPVQTLYSSSGKPDMKINIELYHLLGSTVKKRLKPKRALCLKVWEYMYNAPDCPGSGNSPPGGSGGWEKTVSYRDMCGKHDPKKENLNVFGCV